MVKQFDDKQNELDQMKNTLDCIQRTKDEHLEKIADNCEKLFPIVDKVDEIEAKMKHLLNQQTVAEEKRKEELDEYISKQNKDLIDFMAEIDQKLIEMDKTFEQSKRRIELKYEKM